MKMSQHQPYRRNSSSVGLDRASVHSSRCAFSLLEMMIVLVVMVGILAIAWPNLQKPLRRAGLSQATQKLREAIDESRYQAMTTGTPVFIQLRQGESEVRSGGLDAFATDESDLTASGGNFGESNSFDATNAVSTESQSLIDGHAMTQTHAVAPKVWHLPDNVVITDVTWEDAPSGEGISSGVDDAFAGTEGSRHSNSGYGQFAASDRTVAEVDATEDGFDVLDGAEHEWWLPLTSLGHSRDVEITLLDKTSHESMKVSFSSATGELEIHR
ncbi:MAG: prepilin-type N-terminal cleavage/methylation domain-containing protein [Planctomycetes bacterium]|nr:prepilin-type N-terminal cleavage/methylation domain-containing protein [Planctomycetota bacterium]